MEEDFGNDPFNNSFLGKPIPSLSLGFNELGNVPSTSPKFPLSTNKFCVLLNNVPTEIILTLFVDYVFIGITQTNTFGTWIEAKRDANKLSSHSSFSVNTLFGKRNSILQIYARQLIELISSNPSISHFLLLAITLKKEEEENQKTLQTILALIKSQLKS